MDLNGCLFHEMLETLADHHEQVQQELQHDLLQLEWFAESVDDTGFIPILVIG